jgi:threonine dehydrogenase-like Zn-dependent dehydrogenase
LLRLETDAPDILTECIQSVRKGGIVSVIGDYYKTVNNFPIGALMEKGLRMRGSQVHVQHYWKIVLPLIQSGQFDPTSIITHRFALDRIVEAYDLFDNARDNAVKIVLKPPYRVA